MQYKDKRTGDSVQVEKFGDKHFSVTYENGEVSYVDSAWLAAKFEPITNAKKEVKKNEKELTNIPEEDTLNGV